MGVQAKDLFILSNDHGVIHKLRARVSCHPFLFTLFVKIDIFNRVDHLKFELINLDKITYNSTCSILLQEIKKMSTSSVVQHL